MALSKVPNVMLLTPGGGGGSGAQNYISNGAAEENTNGWATYIESKAVTFTAGVTLEVNLVAHGLSNNDRVSFTSVVTTTGIGTGGLYYVTVKTADTFQISTDPSGAPLLFINNGSGTMGRPLPITGTGGTPGSAVTLARSTSSPLSGLGSFTATKAASNVIGCGYSYDFTIDAKDKARMLQVSFDGIVVSGTFTAGSKDNDSDLTVWILDVTNNKIIQPSNYKLLSNSTTLANKYSATFQSSSDSVSYRLILHHSTGNNAANVYKFDNVSVSPSVYVYGSPGSPWKPYTPVFNGFGTPTTVECYWRQAGENVEITAAFTSGAATAVEARVGLPPGLTSADTTLLPSIRACGPSSPFNVATTNQYIPLIEPSVTYFTIGIQSASASGQTKLATTSSFFGSGNRVNFMASIPIRGWSSSVQMSDGSTPRVVSFTGDKASNQALTAGVTNITFTATSDTHGAWTGSEYIVPAPGDYFVSMSGGTNLSNEVFAYVNGASTKLIVGLVSGSYTSGGNTLTGLNTGDKIGLRAGGITIAGTTKYTTIAISRISGPQTIAASETVAASYGSSLGQAIGASNVVFFNYKDYDTHGMFNPSTGVGTIPISGLYRFHLRVYFGASLPASTNFFAFLRKNTVNAKNLSDKTAAATAAGYELVGGATLQFVAGDTFDFVIGHNAGGTKALYTDAKYVYCTIERVK